MKLEFTLKRPPASQQVLDDCGLPFTVLIRPFCDVPGLHADADADAATTDEDNDADDGGNAAANDAGDGGNSRPAAAAAPERPPPLASELPRCRGCAAYVSGHARFEPEGWWLCALCGKRNDLSAPRDRARYAAVCAAAASEHGGPEGAAAALAAMAVPELRGDVYDVLVCASESPWDVCAFGDDDDEGEQQRQQRQEGNNNDDPAAAAARAASDAEAEPDFDPHAPTFVALVDLSGGEDFVEAVRGALLAAMEALPPGARFGVVGFSDAVELIEPRSAGAAGGPPGAAAAAAPSQPPLCRAVPVLPGRPQQPLLCPLSRAVPLDALLAPVGRWRGALVAAVEALAPRPAAAPRGRRRRARAPSARRSSASSSSCATAPAARA